MSLRSTQVPKKSVHRIDCSSTLPNRITLVKLSQFLCFVAGPDGLFERKKHSDHRQYTALSLYICAVSVCFVYLCTGVMHVSFDIKRELFCSHILRVSGVCTRTRCVQMYIWCANDKWYPSVEIQKTPAAAEEITVRVQGKLNGQQRQIELLSWPMAIAAPFASQTAPFSSAWMAPRSKTRTPFHSFPPHPFLLLS